MVGVYKSDANTPVYNWFNTLGKEGIIMFFEDIHVPTRRTTSQRNWT